MMMLTDIRPIDVTTTAAIMLPSRLDVHVVDDLAHEVRRHAATETSMILLDGAGIHHTDAAGLEFLADIVDETREAGVELRISRPSLALTLASEFCGHADLPFAAPEPVASVVHETHDEIASAA